MTYTAVTYTVGVKILLVKEGGVFVHGLATDQGLVILIELFWKRFTEKFMMRYGLHGR